MILASVGRLQLVVAVAVIAVAVGAASGAWLNGSRWETKYQALQLEQQVYETAVANARAEGLAAGQRLAHDQMERAQEAANARAIELAAVATRAQSQLTGVLRLCPRTSQPVSAATAGGRAVAAARPTAGAGVVSGGLGAAGAVLDPGFIRDRLNRAEQVAADLRTCMAAWPR